MSELQQRVYDSTDNNQLFFPPPNVTAALNMALMFTNILTGWSQVTIPTFTVSPSSTTTPWLYAVPAGILIPTRLDIEGAALSPPISLRRLAREYRDWSTDSTAAMGPIARWCRIGLTAVAVHPFDSIGGSLMEFTGVQPITPLVLPTDTVTLDDQFADVVIKFAKIRVGLKEPTQSFQGFLKDMPELQRTISSMSRWESVRQPEFWLSRTQRDGVKDAI